MRCGLASISTRLENTRAIGHSPVTGWKVYNIAFEYPNSYTARRFTLRLVFSIAVRVDSFRLLTQPFQHLLMDRRNALSRIGLLLGGAISAPAVSGFLAGCTTPFSDGKYVPRTLSDDRYEAIRVLVELILPETDTPGALSAGVDRFVDEMLTDYYALSDRDRFLEGLDRFLETSTGEFGRDFVDLDAESMIDYVRTRDIEAYSNPDSDQLSDPAELFFFRTLKELTIMGFYTSEIGATQELRVMPMGEYRPDVDLTELGRAWA